MRAGLEHDLPAVAGLPLVAAGGRREGAGAHEYALRGREDVQARMPDEWCSEVLVRPRRADGGRDGGVVPQAAAAVHRAREHARDVGRRGDRPGQQLPRGVAGQGGDDVQRETGPDFRRIEDAEFPERQSVPVRHFRGVRLRFSGGDRSLHDAAGRVDVVHHIEGRRRLHGGERLHQHEDILRVVEIARPGVLDLDDDRVQALQALCREGDVVGAGRELGLARRKDDGQIAPLPEQVVHIAPPGGVPAVLRAEAADFPFAQRLVQLVFQRCGPE